jgi:hypothetical protein
MSQHNRSYETPRQRMQRLTDTLGRTPTMKEWLLDQGNSEVVSEIAHQSFNSALDKMAAELKVGSK